MSLKKLEELEQTIDNLNQEPLSNEEVENPYFMAFCRKIFFDLIYRKIQKIEG